MCLQRLWLENPLSLCHRWLSTPPVAVFTRSSLTAAEMIEVSAWAISTEHMEWSCSRLIWGLRRCLRKLNVSLCFLWVSSLLSNFISTVFTFAAKLCHYICCWATGAHVSLKYSKQPRRSLRYMVEENTAFVLNPGFMLFVYSKMLVGLFLISERGNEKQWVLLTLHELCRVQKKNKQQKRAYSSLKFVKYCYRCSANHKHPLLHVILLDVSPPWL